MHEWALAEGVIQTASGVAEEQGLEQAAIHAALSFTAMLAVAHAAVRCREPGLMRSIKHFT
nr:hypothetical protein [Candidatus Bathyarchaeota archaeon]